MAAAAAIRPQRRICCLVSFLMVVGCFSMSAVPGWLTPFFLALLVRYYMRAR
jgi:hypothetical protein